jgi:hypothetical protein
MVERGLGLVEELPAIGKAVGRDVENAHDQGWSSRSTRSPQPIGHGSCADWSIACRPLRRVHRARRQSRPEHRWRQRPGARRSCHPGAPARRSGWRRPGHRRGARPRHRRPAGFQSGRWGEGRQWSCRSPYPDQSSTASR